MNIHRVMLVVGVALASGAEAARAQGRLVGYTETAVGPVYDAWRLSGRGIPQPSIDGSATARVKRASQWSLPVSIAVPAGDRWSFDLTGAFASGIVELDGDDPVTGSNEYQLSGVSDLRLRATGRLLGDNVLLTLGVNVPTGKTELDEEELSALRVLAAPALGFQVPVLGTGGAGTVGVVLARQMAGWAWAFGTSYEMRREYTPVSIAAGLPVDLSPGDAIRLSVGADGLVGQSGLTVGVSADFYTRDRVESPSDGGGAEAATSQLGPIFTGDLQFRVATTRFRELTIYAVDRYRTKYKRDGRTTPGSGANYLDAGVRAVTGLGRSTGFLIMVNGRHHTGLDSDEALTTAAIASGAVTLGIIRDLGGNYSLQPFVRVQGGRLESGDASSTATGLTGGVTLRVRL